jgi:hypothetical protein
MLSVIERYMSVTPLADKVCTFSRMEATQGLQTLAKIRPGHLSIGGKQKLILSCAFITPTI